MQRLANMLLAFAIQAMTTVHRAVVSGRRVSRLAQHLAEVIPLEKRILDIGSGNGRLVRQILDLRPDLEFLGIDVKCDHDSAIPIQEYDGRTFPFESNSWDFCMASDVLHHCDDPMEMLREMNRVAKDGIIVKDHVADSGFDRTILGTMDWIGNIGYGTKVPFNFLSTTEWKKGFEELELTQARILTDLRLYPCPFSLLFDRNLHFIALLNTKNNFPTPTSSPRHAM